MRFIRKLETARLIGWHPSHLMRKAKAGEFPRPVKLGSNSVAFVADEVEQWMQERVNSRVEVLEEIQKNDSANKREAG